MANLLSFDRTSVDCEITKIGKQLLSTVLACDQFEEIGSVVDKLLK